MSMIGKSLVHYEISAELGKGGMGEVYQAKDTKLGRDVAIKVLPEEFATDSDRVARFQREAKLLASLNHPNIAAIHGLEESEGTHFLVMELIEGDTLMDRIKSGPIPVEEALKLALQMAEALEAAHEKGVIHRDLKPANIKVTPDGKVKVLDFGLAKAYAGDQENLSPLDSPTISAAATQQGVILGTAAYMSPEQARGKPVDKRADIWAFGCVLFEMLTGKAAFSGDDVTDTLASVVKLDANMEVLPANLHPRVRELLSRCLQKDTRRRYSSIGDARYEIDQAMSDPSGIFVQPIGTVEPRRNLRSIISWVAAAVIVTALIVGAVVWSLRTPAPPEVTRFYYELPEDQQFSNPNDAVLAVSPDGKHFVYSTTEGLYLRSIGEMDAKLIAGTGHENIRNPFFSPDGLWIGYNSLADNQLKKIPIGGGAPVTLCDVGSGFRGASWGEDSTILYASGLAGMDILRVSANGGTPELIIEGETESMVFPQLLPGGKSVLFTRTGILAQGSAQIMVQTLESGERKELFEGYVARYLPTGHIVFIVGDNLRGMGGHNLFAVPFDLDKLEVTGSQISLVEDIRGPFGVQYEISDSGTLVYLPGIAGALVTGRTLVFVDREGREQPLTAPPNTYRYPKISPDGTQVALTTIVNDNLDIWTWDMDHNNLMRQTFSDAIDLIPLWTQDGKRIVFYSAREEGGVYWKKSDGTGETEHLVSMPDRMLLPMSWSGDRKTLVVQGVSDGMKIDIGTVSMDGDHTFKPLLQADYIESHPNVSPDGRWIAYCSEESGQPEIYVRPFPDVDQGRWQVSTSGGNSPLWSPDGKELFYLIGRETTEAAMRVAVETEPAFKRGTPEVLFHGMYVGFYPNDFPWDIHPDGKRFIMLKPPGTSSQGSTTEDPRKINIVLNWFEELKQRVPVD